MASSDPAVLLGPATLHPLNPTLGGRHSTQLSDTLRIEFELDHQCTEVNMLSIASIGLSEIAILAGVTALACGLPLLGAIIVAVVVLRQEETYPVEQE